MDEQTRFDLALAGAYRIAGMAPPKFIASMERAAWRCVAIIEPLLQRPEEAGEAFREFYQAIREEMAKPATETPTP